jgi:hypothetical protein
MITPERANRPADAGKPGDTEARDPACASKRDDQPCTSFDYIDEAIEESMIASDPPALTPVTAIGPPNGRKNRRNRDQS